MDEQDAVFDHERLEVYKRSLELVEAVDRFVYRFAGNRRHLGWQLHRAASSIPLNIAEGNGRYRRNDKAQFFVVATGSALECAAVLDIGERLNVGSATERAHMRALLVEIVRMLIALSRSVRRKDRP
ncbi:MAG: four helix bundle protein [Candidatus Longimicrobiales bacterium M2_2A_002]